jgi:TolB-like protein/predicted ATPase/Flp pilus assembly protein TadD
MKQDLSAHTNLSHYRIVSKIGAGGMGEVWLAYDERLKRKVALKLLPAELTSDADRVRRFEQEAQAASALNHPNIITVHDIGECEAGRFIVMELVAGRTLRAVITEDNSLATLLALGQQMAKALSAAHAAGITHRDIKPENIMVRDDGYVKILDFGLARLLPATTSDTGAATVSGTTPGMLLGTVAYMSPEQARGEAVSHPSDIFALGIVLYELATKRHPFKAETLVGYLHAITLQTPPSMRSLKPEMPAALDALILQMLEKEANRRPTAGEVAQELQELERHGTGRTPPVPMQTSGATHTDEGFWVAVLPFKWRGANAELEALAEGLTEDIVTGLSRFSYLRVITRSSTLRYAGDSSDVRKTGQELGARYVMEGSLRQAGSTLRVAVQLLDAATGAHLWAETYNRTFSPEAVFELQDELVPPIVSTVADLHGALPRSMGDALRNHSPEQLSPYEAVLRSFNYTERATAEALADALSCLELAVQKAPGNADAWALMAGYYTQDYGQGFNLQADCLERGATAARKAVEIAPSNHLSWFGLAQVFFFQKEFQSFRHAAERAAALNPMDGNSLAFLGEMLIYIGDSECGLELAERAKQLNPHHPGWYWYANFYLAYREGDYRAALSIARKVNLPGHWYEHMIIAATCGQLGEPEAADKALRDLRTLRPEFAARVRKEMEKWWEPEMVEHLIAGLRKAGLEIADEEGVSPPSPASEASAEADQALPEIESRDNKLVESRDEGERLLISPSHPSSASPTLRHTVGREPERNELRAAFKAANDARGSLLCVTGEPGIGKTTLVEDFLAELAADNQCTIARGRCSERLAGTEAYLPLLEALESLLQSDKNLAATMQQLAPTWYAQVVPLNSESEESSRLLAEVKAASQERMKRELASFLTAVAEPQPLVIFFDDLHWADVSTIDLLSFLAGKFDAMRVLIVATYRPSDMLLAKHPFLQIKPDLQARGLCRELQLEFLNEAEIAQYLNLEFPSNRFPTEFPQLIHAKTEGSPLFMADLVRYLRDRGVIAQSSGSWLLAQTLPDIERELPESVRGMIERKIAQLSEDDRKLLVAASVQGYEFDSAVVAEVLGLEADEVEERLEKLERVFAFVKLVSESEFPNRMLTLKYRFVHMLYQNVLYASLRATRKAALSREVAKALERAYGERAVSVANELAALWEAAREFERAADYFVIAARAALQINAHREAAQIAERGLEALLKHPETAERNSRELDLQLTLGMSLQAVRGWTNPRAEAAFSRAQQLCERMGDDPGMFRALLGVGMYHFVRGEFVIAQRLFEQMLRLAEKSQDAALLVTTCACLSATFYYQGEFLLAREQQQRALSLDRREYQQTYLAVFSQDSALFVRREVGACLWTLGYPDQARAVVEEAVALAEQTSHPFSLGGAHRMAAMSHFFCRDWPASQKHNEKVMKLAEEYGLGDFSSYAAVDHTLALAYQKPGDAALERAKQAIDSLRAKGVVLYVSNHLASLAELCGMLGRFAEGLETIAEALAIVEGTGERFWEADIWRVKGDLTLKAADNNSQVEAETCYLRAIEVARRQSAKSFELRAMASLARLWQQQGKRTEAHETLAEIYGWFSEGFDTADLQEAKALLNELQPLVSTRSVSDLPLAETYNSETSGRSRSPYRTDSPSIAVLPFVNISNDSENEYFCDGLAEELIGALSKIEALRVAARTSAFSFKGKETDIREIGQRLNVAAVLEGSVRKAGNRIRISVQLVNVADGYHLWSERYDREMKDIFDVQDEITLTVVDALKMKLLGQEKAAVLKRHTENAEAYQLYLKGRYHANRFTLEGFNRAIEYLNQAIEQDPHYALAYAGIADAYYHAATVHLPPGEAFLEVKAAAAKALELDDTLPEAHTSMALVAAHYDRKLLEAEAGFRRGLELAPNNVLTHQWFGLHLTVVGRFDEAIAELKRAQALDPLSLIIGFLLGWTYYFARQPEKVKEEARKALELEENFWLAHWMLAVGYEQTGQYREALAELEKAEALDDSSWIPAVFARVYGRLGRSDEAQKILDQLTEKSKQQWVTPYLVATAYVSLDQRDQAFEWLHKAFEDYDEWIGCLKIDPALDPLRADPRFLDLLRRGGLPQ